METTTHIVLPVEVYQKLGAWLRQQPYEAVAPVLSFVQQNAKAVEFNAANLSYNELINNDGAAD